jgi:hypothetical protein
MLHSLFNAGSGSYPKQVTAEQNVPLKPVSQSHRPCALHSPCTPQSGHVGAFVGVGVPNTGGSVVVNTVGTGVTGALDGTWVVGAVVGALVGALIGASEGVPIVLVGSAVGLSEGTEIVGNEVGASEGAFVVGVAVGWLVGGAVVGADELGDWVGDDEGDVLGAPVGAEALGRLVGDAVVGTAVGASVVGACVGGPAVGKSTGLLLGCLVVGLDDGASLGAELVGFLVVGSRVGVSTGVGSWLGARVNVGFTMTIPPTGPGEVTTDMMADSTISSLRNFGCVFNRSLRLVSMVDGVGKRHPHSRSEIVVRSIKKGRATVFSGLTLAISSAIIDRTTV